MVGKAKAQTKHDRERDAIIREIGCLACNIEGWPGVPCEKHHELDDDGQRFEDEHTHTIGLCAWHHRGVTHGLFRGCPQAMSKAHGPSLALNRRAFDEHYGNRDQRLLMQDSLIRIAESARRRGEYLPADEIARVARALRREVGRHRAAC